MVVWMSIGEGISSPDKFESLKRLSALMVVWITLEIGVFDYFPMDGLKRLSALMVVWIGQEGREQAHQL